MATNPDVEAIADLRREHPRLRFVDILLADLNGIIRGKRAYPSPGPEAAFACERSDFIRDYFGADFQKLFVASCRNSSRTSRRWNMSGM